MKESVERGSTAEYRAPRQQRPTEGAVARCRWITIGRVQWPWFVFEMGSGSPDGYLMSWRGKLRAFQPCEFRRAEHLCWAVERRLSLSKLQWVAMTTEIERTGLYGERAVKVLVKRQKEEGRM